MEHPKAFDDLQKHPTEEHELVLMVRRPNVGAKGHDFKVKTFSDRTDANRALKEEAAR